MSNFHIKMSKWLYLCFVLSTAQLHSSGSETLELILNNQLTKIGVAGLKDSIIIPFFKSLV